MNILEREGAAFSSDLMAGNLAFCQSGEGGSIEPHDLLSLNFHTGARYNHYGYSNKDFDRLCDEADVEQNESKRIALYRQAEQILLDDAIIIPMYLKVQQMLIKPYVKDYQVNGSGLLPHYQTRIAR